MKTEPAEKGKQVSRQFSESSSGVGTSTRVMKWPTITKEDTSEDVNINLIHSLSFSVLGR
jgi:hypothetical protein